jgi:hypothetical protein
MTPENDLTLRNMFVKDRRVIRWDDESRYHYAFGKEHNSKYLNNDRLLDMIGLHLRLSYVVNESEFFKEDEYEEDYHINLHKILGDSIKYVTGGKEKVEAYYGMYGMYSSEENRCDCCGKRLNWFNKSFNKYGDYLCGQCDSSLDNASKEECLFFS